MQCKVVVAKNDFMKVIKLGEHHYNEVERRFTGLPYKPKISMFLQLFESGLLHCVALYDGAKVEGYVLFSICPSLFSENLIAQELGVFVNRKYRGEGWFKRMLELAEQELTMKGVGTVMLAFKSGMKHSLGEEYVEAETFYAKNLEN